jgi:hypothetical protein
VTWEGYWLPHLIDWTLGAVVTVSVGWLFRKWILKALDARIDAVFGHAISADVSALHAAQDASAMRADIAQLEARLTGEVDVSSLQQQLEAARKGYS